MEITVLHKQSILDISIKYTGSVLNAFEIAVANGRSVSDELMPGESLEIPNTSIKDDDILMFYKAKKVNPATAELNLSTVEERKGIGAMKVGFNFKVD